MRIRADDLTSSGEVALYPRRVERRKIGIPIGITLRDQENPLRHAGTLQSYSTSLRSHTFLARCGARVHLTMTEFDPDHPRCCRPCAMAILIDQKKAADRHRT